MRAPILSLATLCLVVASCTGPAASPPAPRRGPEADAALPSASATSPESPAPDAPLPEPPRPRAARGATTRAPQRPDDARRDISRTERHEPSRLNVPPQRSSILPGPYACKVDVTYKLRDCTVELDFEGRTWLTVHEGGLLALKGVLFDEENEVVFEGALTDEKPFGCPACVAGCTNEALAEAAECVAQPVFIRFHRAGKRWEGKLEYLTFIERFEGAPPEGRVVGFGRKNQSFQVVLVPRGIR